jgi:hypothetical protein
MVKKCKPEKMFFLFLFSGKKRMKSGETWREYVRSQMQEDGKNGENQ